MEGINRENIILLLLALVLLYITFKFIKGIIKLLLAVILILTLGVSLYNIFIAQKPISYEINRYKTDFAYLQEAGRINKETYEILKVVKDDKGTEENIKSLELLYEKAENLDHSNEISFIHNQYIKNFQKVIASAKGYITAQGAKEYLNDLSEGSKSLKINIIDILFPKEGE